MTSLNELQASQKPVETIHPSHLPPESQDPSTIAHALSILIDHSIKNNGDVSHGIHAPMHKLESLETSLIHKLVPGIERIASEYHVGNFVMTRGTGERVFESMPLYPRLGMHLLYYGGTQNKILHNRSVEEVLKDLSIRQGKAYDSPESVKSIPSFINTYSIPLNDLLEPDIKKYNTFNDFFYRKLKPNTRPIQNQDDPAGICSAADCRLTLYESVDLAKHFWIKGNNFTVPTLLNVAPDSETAKLFQGGSLASFRLAPSDYHRFHSPIDGAIGDIVDIPGEYYTVNPQAVNESGFDVFTSNKRSVLYMKHTQSDAPIAFVAIGAMLVGSIRWTGGAQKGSNIKRGDELGFFAYGGSTIVVIFPKGTVKWDDDLMANSKVPIETLMKVGCSVGKSLVSLS